MQRRAANPIRIGGTLPTHMITLDDHNTLDRWSDQIVAFRDQFVIDRVVQRLWAGDASLWYPARETQDRIRQRLGWLHLPDDTNTIADRVAAIKTRSERVTYVAGGAAGDVARLWRDLAAQNPIPPFDLLDAADPDRVFATLHALDWQRTHVVLAAPPDNAPEAAALIDAVQAAWRASLPASADRITILAPPDVPVLDRFADAPPRVIALPSDVGSRFGALGPLGLVPAALAGWNLDPLVDRARAMRAACINDDLTQNPGVRLGIALGVLAQGGRDLLALHMPPPLTPLARWLAAFVAGSLSKHGRGFVPLVNPAIAGQGARDRVRVVIRNRNDPTPPIANDQPLLDITLDDPADVAGVIMGWQVAVATAALIVGLNPFDEPDTDALHGYMQRLMEREDRVLIPVDDAAALDRFLPIANRTRFVAIVIFGAAEDRVLQLVDRLDDRINVPTFVIRPARDYAYAAQLLHAGRSDGAIIAIVNGLPRSALDRARIAAHLYAWRRMKRELIVIHGAAAVGS
jgi:hypothetical protein